MAVWLENDELWSGVAKAKSIRDALFVLKTSAREFGGCDIAYEFVIRRASHVRGDLVSMTTLSRRYTDLYYPDGGPNSDPVLENIDNEYNPFIIDLKPLCLTKGSKYAANKFFNSLLQNGHRYLSAYPFESDARIGRIILTVFSNQKQFDLKIDPAQFIDIGRRLHRSFKNNGQLKDYFGIEEKEQLVLSRMADGKTAADIAQELDVTVRTIEMRLQNARKKLKARTTTEAVYKSVAYGILPI